MKSEKRQSRGKRHLPGSRHDNTIDGARRKRLPFCCCFRLAPAMVRTTSSLVDAPEVLLVTQARPFFRIVFFLVVVALLLLSSVSSPRAFLWHGVGVHAGCAGVGDADVP